MGIRAELEEASLPVRSHCPWLPTPPSVLLLCDSGLPVAPYEALPIGGARGSQQGCRRSKPHSLYCILPRGSNCECHFRIVASLCGNRVFVSHSSSWNQFVFSLHLQNQLPHGSQRRQQEPPGVLPPETWVPSPQGPFSELRYAGTNRAGSLPQVSASQLHRAHI